ncbi:ribonuclease P protein component [Stappia sp.]|uniref:ribonuclease P protein component n=1 Tax=Stappia sp. TaxID=1870903 RepID=UPI0025E9A7C9|nr:ribonuclease P protein component [Stappia sp.]
MSATLPSDPVPPDTLPTLKKRAEFLAIAKGGRLPRRAFVLQAAPVPGPPRIGYTVTKKTGNAVERNRIRRRLRAAVREVAAEARHDVSYVLVGRRGALSQDFQDLLRDLSRGLARAPLSAETSPRPARGKKGSRTQSRPAPARSNRPNPQG